MKWPRWLRNAFPRFFPFRWEDGEVSTDPRYAVWYADLVQRIEAAKAGAALQKTMLVTVRLYDRMPPPFESTWGKVLPPNSIAGDTGGTLCMRRDVADETLFMHEAAHCITGESGHPAWLYKQDNNSYFLAV